MKLILCVDEAMGMAFLGRRLSRDRAVTERIAALGRSTGLFVTPYSASLFGQENFLRISEDPARAAGDEDFVFLETMPAPTENVRALYLFHWKRRYPSDLKFPLDAFSLKRVATEEFCGFSHETLLFEQYEVLS